MSLAIALKSSENDFSGELDHSLFQKIVYNVLHARIEFQRSKAVSHLKSWNYVCQMFQTGPDLVLF